MIKSNRHLIEIFFTKLVFNLRSEASETYLGYIWWVLEPVLYVAVLYLVFGTFLGFRGGGDFVVFLICGKIPFLWFSKSVTHSSNSIMAGRGLIDQVVIPKAFFPLLVVFRDLVKQFFVFFLMIVFLLLYGLEPSLNWFLLVFVFLTELLLIIAFSLLVAAIIPFLPDFKFIVATGMMLLMFSSGIFFSYKDVILEKHQSLFLMNPIANLIKNSRQVLMDNLPPDWLALASISFFSLVLIVVMLAIYRKAGTTYAKLAVQ